MNEKKAKELLELKRKIAQATNAKQFNAAATYALKWGKDNLSAGDINMQSIIKLITEQKQILQKRKGK